MVQPDEASAPTPRHPLTLNPRSDIDNFFRSPFYKRLATCDVGVVCIDTPMAQNGACDTSKVCDELTLLPIDCLLLKSTVAPGTTDLLSRQTGKQICFSPEYIGESSYYHPFWADGVRDVPFVILGGEPVIRRWFIDLLLPVLGPTKVYFQCSALEAEIIKYMENAYFYHQGLLRERVLSYL